MQLSLLDALIVLIPISLYLVLGFWQRKRAQKSEEEFFLSGRNLPWWLLGISMVATTFSTDTPNLVSDLVRKNGVSGNWAWWAFLLTGMLTVFVYAKLWRRSEMMTDLEFYELRYGGKSAALLRGFRALYLGFFFNIAIMAGVMLAGIKIMNVLMAWPAWLTITLSGAITVIYSSLGGLRSVIYADLFQFVIAMVGTIAAAWYILQLPEIGGLSALISHPEVQPSTHFLPDFSNPENLWMVFVIPLAVQWWSVWYPGSEPGGGGYIVQRMLAAKNERHAVFATLFFNFAHYALRPWPWILIALASMVTFPTTDHIQEVFPMANAGIIDDDMAYPAMLSLLPAGLLGLVLLSLISAFMSTISTHLNWGASYIAHDFYKRFVHPEASQKTIVAVGRASTVLLIVLSSILALFLDNAKEAFDLLLQIGAGTGLIFILRWFWWRINAYSEITAMLISFLVALIFSTFDLFQEWAPGVRLCTGVGITTFFWVTVTLLTPPESDETLIRFLQKVRPHLPGWKSFIRSRQLDPQKFTSHSSLAIELTGFFVSVPTIYALLFGTGFFLYGSFIAGWVCLLITLIGSYIIFKLVRQMW